jgi:NAD(P)-dependent dehydrogenase (short-subunit alcohol dehydrogenase family)
VTDGGPRLDGRVALVTGGGSGIGRGIAARFVAAGARVVACGRRREPLRDLERELGESVVSIVADVTIAADRERLVDETLGVAGRLDALVNCAGFVRSGPIHDVDERTWERLLTTNVVAPILLASRAMPALRERRGCIVNVSTGASLKPVPGFGGYAASKAALNYASAVLALEAAPHVRVNVICPGGVDTPIFESFLPEDQIAGAKEFFEKTTPLGRIGTPADIAEAALYLASDAAAWVTGAVLTVDGGLNLG